MRYESRIAKFKALRQGSIQVMFHLQTFVHLGVKGNRSKMALGDHKMIL